MTNIYATWNKHSAHSSHHQQTAASAHVIQDDNHKTLQSKQRRLPAMTVYGNKNATHLKIDHMHQMRSNANRRNGQPNYRVHTYNLHTYDDRKND